MRISPELQATINGCRQIIEEIKRKQERIGGGSGRRERYEMRDTGLYFDLGSLLLTQLRRSGISKEKRGVVYAAITAATQDLDLYEGIIRWSVRFVEAFEDRQYFLEVSELCRHSFGQLREVVDLLARSNPLGVSQPDLERLRAILRADTTYDQRRLEAKAIRMRYTGEGLDIDYGELEDLFSGVEERIMAAFIDEKASGERERLRATIGQDSITALRYTLMLLGREATFEEVQRSRKGVLRKALGADMVLDQDIARLHQALAKFLSADRTARDNLRRWVRPDAMGNLQKMLKAMESEKEYENYRKTEQVFKNLL